MKLIKWGIFFLLAFLISFVLLRTFSQEAFRQTAPARILGYLTPQIPIYTFIAGAFITGLLIGLCIVVYTYITFTAEGIRKSKRINELEKQVDYFTDQAEQISSHFKSSEKLESSVEDSRYAEDDRENEKELNQDDGEVDAYLG